ncbi:Hypothetical predicted protein [Pelobates cultripes]|uniref:Uncharacterized protein n=1 Tax=Pelobates cultripes TaxID=61616 RepID=A0AAD1VP02_PELCU|nr:Hypothetical predicted protein [Pelobates cultripes]
MVPSGRKAMNKSHHVTKIASKNDLTDRLRPVDIEDAVLPSRRAHHRAKAVQTWKWCGIPDSSDSYSDSEEVSDGSDAIDLVYSEDSSPEHSVTAPTAIEARQEAFYLRPSSGTPF